MKDTFYDMAEHWRLYDRLDIAELSYDTATVALIGMKAIALESYYGQRYETELDQGSSRLEQALTLTYQEVWETADQILVNMQAARQQG